MVDFGDGCYLHLLEIYNGCNLVRTCLMYNAISCGGFNSPVFVASFLSELNCLFGWLDSYWYSFGRCWLSGHEGENKTGARIRIGISILPCMVHIQRI